MRNSIWSNDTKIPARETLSKDIRTDVLIIGGGLCGILCAYFLHQQGIDYALVEALTKVGIIGVKVWICRGEVYGKRDLAPSFTTNAKESRGAANGPKKGFRKPKNNR